MTTFRERTSVLCLRNDCLLSIKMKDPISNKKYWSFPGGGIESNETSRQCATRETLEETGYNVNLTSEAFINYYKFHWNGKTYNCKTHWYTAELASERKIPVDDEFFILHSSWLVWPKSRPLFFYNPGILEALNHWLPIEGKTRS